MLLDADANNKKELYALLCAQARVYGLRLRKHWENEFNVNEFNVNEFNDVEPLEKAFLQGLRGETS